MKQKRILVLSNATIDFVQKVRRVPYSGETVVEEELPYAYTPGGNGALSAITFARLGADCIFGTKLGRDANARRLLSMYQREGIDIRYIAEDDHAPTGLASVLAEENGKKRTIVYPGANMTMTADDADGCFTPYPDAVYLQFGLPDEAVIEASRRAERAGVPLFIDSTPARLDFPLQELGKVEIFSPNEMEIRVFTGITPSSEESCLRAAIKLASQIKAKYIVIKRGEHGSFIYDGREYYVVPAEPVTVVDPSAAGDVFTAVMTYVYLKNQNIVSAVKYATCAAALTVSREGSVESIPTLAEIVAYAKQKTGNAPRTGTPREEA